MHALTNTCTDAHTTRLFRLLNKNLLTFINKLIILLTIFRGANKEVEDEDCNTPLLTAIAHGQQEALSKLISLGCTTDVRGSNGRSAVFIAAEKDKSEVLEVYYRCTKKLEISIHSYVLFPPNIVFIN